MNRIVITCLGKIISYLSFVDEKIRSGLRSWMWRVRIEAKQGRVGTGFWVKKGSFFDLGRQSQVTIGKNVIIDENVRIYVGEQGRLVIGDDVFIGCGSFLVANRQVVIGQGTQIAHSVTIIDTDHEFRNPDVALTQQGDRRAAIEIGKEVWIATQSVVLKGRRIGDHSVIGANTVVTQNVRPVSVLAGKKQKSI